MFSVSCPVGAFKWNVCCGWRPLLRMNFGTRLPPARWCFLSACSLETLCVALPSFRRERLAIGRDGTWGVIVPPARLVLCHHEPISRGTLRLRNAVQMRPRAPAAANDEIVVAIVAAGVVGLVGKGGTGMLCRFRVQAGFREGAGATAKQRQKEG